MSEVKTCCFCASKINSWGNNPSPLTTRSDTYCCDECNNMYVIPARLNMLFDDDVEKLKKVADNDNLFIRRD